MSAPGVIIAGSTSGCGTTTLTLALLRALACRGFATSAFQVGPNPVGPALHARACGRPCLNLDCWAMRLETLAGLGDHLADGADLILGEATLGLFDDADDGGGSSGDLAGLFDLPVVLVVDAHNMGASAAALALGFIHHRDDVEIAGMLFNRVRSERHSEILRRACDDHFSQPVLGCLPDDERLRLPEPLPGRMPAGEPSGLAAFLDGAADLASARIDLERLVRLARPFGLGLYGPRAQPLKPLGQRIALARDGAFAYAATLDGWRAAGAEILPFSPLAGEGPDPRADAVFLPGGWPEPHAASLAGNAAFLERLRAHAEAGAFVYGECGGFIALGERLIDAQGRAHAMAGLLPLSASFEQTRQRQGYRRVRLIAPSPLGQAGATFRGHEGASASITVADGTEPLFEIADARGRPLGTSGLRAGNVAGSLVRLIDRSFEPEGTFPGEPRAA